ncbi:MAG: hypothetical protein RIS84_1279, partial [Pseudomonadota bacterium]
MWHFIRLFLFCLSLWGLSLSSQAATILVNSLADNLTTNSLCTLREAINNANADSAIHTDCAAGSGADTIELSTGSLGVAPYVIPLSSELPAISSSITLRQSGTTSSAGNFIIRGGASFRVLRVTSGTVQFIDLSMVNGNTTDGGALYIDSSANVTLANVAIQGNTASNSGGGIYNNGTLTLQTNSILKGNLATISGGGIHNQAGTVTLDASQIGITSDPNRVNNPSLTLGTSMGGGIANINGTLNINNTSKVCSNTVVYLVGNALGGGIYSSDGTVTISNNSEICNNFTDSSTAQSHGAGVYSLASTGSGTNLTIQAGSKVYGNLASGLTADNRGGGIYQKGPRDLVLNNAVIGISGSANQAAGGAGIYNNNTNVTIQNNTQVCYNETITLSGNSVGGGIYNDHTSSTGKKLLIDNSTFCFNKTNGSASSSGGAIANYGNGGASNLVIQNLSQFYGNEATTTGSAYLVGGAIYNNSAAGVTIDNSTIGTATNPNRAQDGAGIYNGAGTLTVQNNSVISYNATSTTGSGTNGNGAGIYNTATVTVNNSTVSHNIAAYDGAGVYNAGTLNLNGATLSYNNASHYGGGLKNAGFLNLASSKLLYNSASTASALYQYTGFSASVGTNNCIVQNFNSVDDVYNDPANPVQSMNGVWWGSSDGASGGALTGHGESISNVSQGTFLTTAPTGCPDPAYSSSPATGTINIGTTAVSTPISTNINITEGGNADLWVKLAGGSLATALTGTNAADFTVLGSFPLHVTQ